MLLDAPPVRPLSLLLRGQPAWLWAVVLAWAGLLGIDRAVAQAGPGIVNGSKPSSVFNQTNLARLGLYLPNASQRYLASCSAYRLSEDAPGTWTWAMTVYGADKRFGNTSSLPSGDFVVLGKLDEPKGAYVPGTLASALNHPGGGNFCLSLSGDGVHAVLDWAAGVYYSQRTTIAHAFPAPVAVRGLPPGAYFDPALGLWDGKLMLFFVDHYTSSQYGLTRIRMQELDTTRWPSTVTVIGTPTTVAEVALPGPGNRTLHSPTPVLGPDGRVHGLFLAEQMGGWSPMFFKPDLRLATGHEQQMAPIALGFHNNGACLGGRLYNASATTTSGLYFALIETDVAWLVGDDVAIGQPASILGAVWDVNQGLNLTLLFAAARLYPMAGGLAIPGIGGALGLDPVTTTLFALMQHDAATQRAITSFTVPNLASLRGISVPIQGLSIDAGSPMVQTFTNTAWINVR